jgi:hypothetical protein
MKYEVQTLTWLDGWVNTWSINGDPEYFDTYEDAEFALHELLKDIHEAYEEGFMSDDYDPSDYRISIVDLSWTDQFDQFFIRQLG